MIERRRSLREWAILAATAAVATLVAALLVWIALTALADNVDIAYGLGIHEQVAAWLELVPVTLLTGATVGLVARLRRWRLAMPALMSTAAAAILLGAYQIASIGRTAIEESGESIPVYLAPPAWAMWLAIIGGALLGILVVDVLNKPQTAEFREAEVREGDSISA